jgi:serine/threonine-protein kinase RsbW
MSDSETSPASRRVTLSVPSRPEFLGLVHDTARGGAALAGFRDDARKRVAVVVQQLAATLVLAATHDVLTVDLTCEVVPGGLTVTLHDDGPPFDPSHAGDADAFVRGLLKEGSADWVEFRNEGRGGKTVRMMFHHRSAAREEEADLPEGDDDAIVIGGRGAWELRGGEVEPLWELDPEDSMEAPPAAAGEATGDAITYGLLRREQAASVSECIFDAYRLTYLHEDMYHPLRIAELNASGAMISVVAAAPDGTVVGHFALSFPDEARDVPELGIAATRRAWRGQHVARRLADLLMSEAASRGLYGVFADAITVHPYTQHLNVQLGFGTCGLRLATIPPDREFRGMEAQSRHRQSAIVMYRNFSTPSTLPLDVPERHRAMIARLYEWAGAPGRLDGSPPGVLDAARDDRAETSITVRLEPATSVATLRMSGFGGDLHDRLRDELRRLRESELRVIVAGIDMTRPGAAAAATQLEELGFFFTGVLPAGPQTDLVLFQYFNGVLVDYDLMKIDSDETRELIAYVRALDPDAL